MSAAINTAIKQTVDLNLRIQTINFRTAFLQGFALGDPYLTGKLMAILLLVVIIHGGFGVGLITAALMSYFVTSLVISLTLYSIYSNPLYEATHTSNYM